VAAQRDAEEQADLDEQLETVRPDLWSEVRIDPVEIALPTGVGYTLRAYRLVDEITPTDVSERETDVFPDRQRPPVEEDEEFDFGDAFPEEDEDDLADDDLAESESDKDADEDEDDLDGADDDLDGDERAGTDAADGQPDDDESDDDEEESEAAAKADPEEVPVFLGRRGQLYLFRSPEGLAEFIRSGAEHDLSQLDTWSDLADRVTAEDVVPLAEDTYELDLVVKNLRGGRDAWDPDLLIQAGEIARDIGYALQIGGVVSALAPGSPLDDLDEALRATTSGGIGGFLAKRRMKKIGAEAAPLGWRTIIGKISSVVDWRD
jgi:hypothetical protein